MEECEVRELWFSVNRLFLETRNKHLLVGLAVSSAATLKEE